MISIVSKQVDLSMLLHDVVETVLPLAEAKQLDLRYDIAAGLVMMGDSDNLVRLFMNLLENGVKYTNTGEIHIQAKAVQDHIEVGIADTGVGIRQEDLPYLFERFYRADGGRGRATGGFGLGLAIAQAVAQAHGGTISARSEIGQGTTMLVILPIGFEA
jgi:signal transduction histidine kinase